jgi:hypothetical protein
MSYFIYLHKVFISEEVTFIFDKGILISHAQSEQQTKQNKEKVLYR